VSHTSSDIPTTMKQVVNCLTSVKTTKMDAATDASRGYQPFLLTFYYRKGRPVGNADAKEVAETDGDTELVGDTGSTARRAT
jgi:hypothetical protein